jgi:hypothetical protein
MPKSSAQWSVSDSTHEVFQISFDTQKLTTAIQNKLLPSGETGSAIIWVDGDSEVIVQVNRLRLALKPGLILIELAMAEDELGEATLVVPFRVGQEPAEAVLLAVTEDLPRGNSALSLRWGQITQGLLWEAIQAIGRERWQNESGSEQLTLCGLYTDGAQLFYLFSAQASAQDVADYFQQQDGTEGDFDPIPVELPKQESSGCLLAFFVWIAALGRGLLAFARLTLTILRKLWNLILRRA